MKENIKNYIFILFNCLFIFYFVYNNKNNEYILYLKIVDYLSLEFLGIFLFYLLEKNKLFLKNKHFFISIFCFLSAVFLERLGISYLEYLAMIIVLINVPIIFYSFILFLIKENNLYFFYAILSLLFAIIYFILESELVEFKIVLKIFIVYTIIGISYLIILKKNKNKSIIAKNNIKKELQIIIVAVIRLLIIGLLLIYKPEKIESIADYKETVIFISFELFGIFMFYNFKKYIKNLNKKMSIYLFFSFFIIKTFEYLSNEGIGTLFFAVMVDTILFVFILFLFSIIKKNIFYISYAIIELIWCVYFMIANLISTAPELNRLLNIYDFFLPYIIISLLYFLLFEKNEKSIINREKQMEKKNHS